MTYDFKNFKDDSLTRPRDVAWSNFAKFEKVGDKVQGFIKDAFYKPESGVYKEQRGITLEQEDGTLVNVGIKTLSFILAKTDNLHIGDPLTIVFESEKKNGPGLNATKIIEFYGKELPENADNPTVKELYEKDKAQGGTEAVEEVEDDSPEVNDKPF